MGGAVVNGTTGNRQLSAGAWSNQVSRQTCYAEQAGYSVALGSLWPQHLLATEATPACVQGWCGLLQQCGSWCGGGSALVDCRW